jgi:hypothetical protein
MIQEEEVRVGEHKAKKGLIRVKLKVSDDRIGFIEITNRQSKQEKKRQLKNSVKSKELLLIEKTMLLNFLQKRNNSGNKAVGIRI